jgi:hypothetical protein
MKVTRLIVDQPSGAPSTVKLKPEQKTAMLENIRHSIDDARMKDKKPRPMFTFKFGGKEYNVCFRHYRKAVAGTRCIIWMGDKYWVTGDAFLSEEDQFCRRVGRKVALAKALKKMNMTKEMRKTRVWDAYFAVHGKVE